MNQQESPNMDKAQERVTFITPSLRYTLHLETEHMERIGGQFVLTPAKLIRFEEGKYSTDDLEEIKRIRACKPFRRGKIKEITEVIKKAMAAPVQKTVRGAITSTSLKKEAGVEEKSQGTRLREMGITECPESGCDYVVRNDLSGKKMNMHKIGKHRLGMRPKPKEASGGIEVPKEEGAKEGSNLSLQKNSSLGEAKKGLKELKVEK